MAPLNVLPINAENIDPVKSPWQIRSLNIDLEADKIISKIFIIKIFL